MMTMIAGVQVHRGWHAVGETDVTTIWGEKFVYTDDTAMHVIGMSDHHHRSNGSLDIQLSGDADHSYSMICIAANHDSS